MFIGHQSADKSVSPSLTQLGWAGTVVVVVVVVVVVFVVVVDDYYDNYNGMVTSLQCQGITQVRLPLMS